VPTEEQVRESLDGVLVPGAMRSLTKMNLVREVAVSDHKVKVSLASTALNEETRGWIKGKVEETIKALPDVKEAETEFVEAKLPEVNDIKHVVAVMSGKGGVGKSLVSGLLGPGQAGPGCGYPGWRHHRTEHTPDVWHDSEADGQ